MREIIVLNNQLQQDGTTLVNYVYWLSVPTSLQVAAPSATSLVPNATQAELTALQNGSVIERQFSTLLSAGFAQSDVGNQLVRGYNQQQSILNQAGTAKQYAGAYWDGATWHNLPA